MTVVVDTHSKTVQFDESKCTKFEQNFRPSVQQELDAGYDSAQPISGHLNTSARTTFYDDGSWPKDLHERLHDLHHDFNVIGAEHKRTKWQKTLSRRDDDRNFSKCILTALDVPQYLLNEVPPRLEKINLNGFSAHYDGRIGATIGLAMFLMFDSVDDVLNSVWVLLIESTKLLKTDVDVKALLNYSFRKFSEFLG
jgi:hypothetical protein